MISSKLRYLPKSEVKWTREADVVIVGTGAAGLSAALTANAWGQRVIILCKGGPGGGSTPLAQGGLAAVMDREDSLELHVTDTLVAGAGLSQESSVAALVSEEEIIETMRMVTERLECPVEPSGAVAASPALHRQLASQGRKIGIILSGGNLDTDAIPA